MLKNVILNSQSRELFGITISQKIDNEMLSITDLKEAYTRARIEKGWSNRTIEKIAESETFKERVYYMLLEAKKINLRFRDFIQNCDDKGFFKYMKELGVYKTTGARENKKTFADPYLFVAFALELNPEIYGKVVVWLTDGLIFNRLEACGNYKEMNTKLKELLKLEKDDYLPYLEVAIIINKKVFGKHMNGIRNLATKDQLKQIDHIEKSVTGFIKSGFCKSLADVKQYINNL